jgi:hypothetical protein
VSATAVVVELSSLRQRDDPDLGGEWETLPSQRREVSEAALLDRSPSLLELQKLSLTHCVLTHRDTDGCALYNIAHIIIITIMTNVSNAGPLASFHAAL